MSNTEEYIIFGGPEPDNLDENTKSLGEFILKRLENSGDQVLIIDGVTSEPLTACELRKKSIELALCMRNAGLKKGDVVGVCSENRLEFPVALFASIYLGLTISPINLTYTEREINHAINLSRPKFIFTSEYIADKIVNVAKKNSFIKNVVLFGNNTEIKGLTVLSDFIKRYTRNTKEIFKAVSGNIKEDVVLILCSSGTTGLPKGVQLTQFNVMASISYFGQRSIASHESLSDVVILGVIPWFHAFGCLTLLGTTCNGIRLVLLPKFEEGLFLSCIENYKVTVIFMVPPLMVFLAKHPLVDQYDLSSLKELLCGAAPLSKETEDSVYARIGVQSIRQGYGMSETTLSVLSQIDDLTKPGSVGTVGRGIWAKVINPETGEILGPNKPGELCFKGSAIMKGYIGDVEATKNTIDKDKWLHSGDIGYYDNDKHFYIIDRLKELIKYKAYQVPPAEIESILLTNPLIKDAAVIGLPDEASGELPLAFVVKQPDAVITEQEIIKFVEERVSSAKRLRGGVRFINDIPKNVSGKILRRELRDLLKKQPKSKL